jgi:peroxiredoxin
MNKNERVHFLMHTILPRRSAAIRGLLAALLMWPLALLAQQPSLQNKLDARKAESAATKSEELKRDFRKGMQQMRAQSIEANALYVGAPAPDFVLPRAGGDSLRLSEVLRKGPVVLTWYRGGWCPYCNMTLHHYQEHLLPRLGAYNATLIALSPELPDSALSTRELHRLRFPVLSDTNNHAAAKYGITFTVPEVLKTRYREVGIDLPAYNGEDSWQLPAPATFVVDRRGIIQYAFIATDYTKRAEPAAILRTLKRLHKQ